MKFLLALRNSITLCIGYSIIAQEEYSFSIEILGLQTQRAETSTLFSNLVDPKFSVDDELSDCIS